MADMYGQGNSLHEGNQKPLRGFTPRQRLDAADPMLRVIGATTEAISLAGANTAPETDILGQKYDLGGFTVGRFRVSWAEGASFATFQSYRDGSGDAQVKVVDFYVADNDVVGTLAAENRSADSAVGVAEDADSVNFFVDSTSGHLVLQNGVDADDGTDPGPVIKFAMERIG